MSKTNDHLESIDQIRSIMERSTTFMSLTGLSGVMAGLFGILTFVLVSLKLDSVLIDSSTLYRMVTEREVRHFLVTVAACALAVTLLTALGLTMRKAKKRGKAAWNNVSRLFAMHMFLPLCAGGLFTIALAYHGQIQLVCPAMLLFFGLSLLSAARFVQMDMFWLGTVEICLGIIGSYWYQAGLILWVAGFGVATLVYGTLMYYKYER
jgi:hypothetical protein